MMSSEESIGCCAGPDVCSWTMNRFRKMSTNKAASLFMMTSHASHTFAVDQSWLGFYPFYYFRTHRNQMDRSKTCVWLADTMRRVNIWKMPFLIAAQLVSDGQCSCQTSSLILWGLVELCDFVLEQKKSNVSHAGIWMFLMRFFFNE